MTQNLRSFTPILALRTVTLAVLFGTSARAQVELRGGAFVDAPVISVSPAGVAVESPGAPGAPGRVFAWSEVKRVAGAHESEAKVYAPLSDDLWRAVARLERGDVALAAPIFERLWNDARANDADPQTLTGVRLLGPTGLAIAEGVASVRIAQERLAEAVEPWAASIALRRTVGGEASTSAPLLDPALPPVFVQSVAAERLAMSEPHRVIRDDAVALALFSRYRAAAAQACGMSDTPTTIDPALATNADLALVDDLLTAQFGSEDAQRGVESRLRQVVATQAGGWREAWARLGLGIAAVKHEEGRARLLGALDLLHVPARFASSQPYLAGVALAWASIALDAEADAPHALALRQELETQFPLNPSIGWLARRAADGGTP